MHAAWCRGRCKFFETLDAYVAGTRDPEMVRGRLRVVSTRLSELLGGMVGWAYSWSRSWARAMYEHPLDIMARRAEVPPSSVTPTVQHGFVGKCRKDGELLLGSGLMLSFEPLRGASITTGWSQLRDRKRSTRPTQSRSRRRSMRWTRLSTRSRQHRSKRSTGGLGVRIECARWPRPGGAPQ